MARSFTCCARAWLCNLYASRNLQMVSSIPDVKTIQFPRDRSLGELYTLSDNGASTFLGEAIGPVKVPDGAKLALYFSFDELLGCQPLTRVQSDLLHSVSFLGAEITDEDLEHVGRLTHLRQLDVSCTDVGDIGLHFLEGLTKLKRINLSSTKITNISAPLFSWYPDLTELQLDDTDLGDGALEYLGRLQTLETLSLSFTKITDKGLTALKSLKNLKVLRLNCTKVTDAGVTQLCRMTSLRELWLRSTLVTYPGMVELTKWLPDCEIIR